MGGAIAELRLPSSSLSPQPQNSNQTYTQDDLVWWYLWALPTKVATFKKCNRNPQKSTWMNFEVSAAYGRRPGG